MSFYEQFVTFTRESGNQMYACCPFHAEKTPSFTVNLDTNEWYCHGCGKGGTEKEFISEYFDVDAKIGKYAFKYWEDKGTLPFPTDETVDTLQKLWFH